MYNTESLKQLIQDHPEQVSNNAKILIILLEKIDTIHDLILLEQNLLRDSSDLEEWDRICNETKQDIIDTILQHEITA